MEKSGENGSEDLILRKLNKNNNNNCQQPEQGQTSSKLLNRKTGETHIISFHGRVKPGIQSTNASKRGTRGFQVTKWRVSEKVLNNEIVAVFINYFWILREHREFGDTIAIVRRTSYVFWKNRLDFGF